MLFHRAGGRIGDYKLGRTIGKGAFSVVKLGKHRLSGEKVAIKIVDKEMLASEEEKSSASNHRTNKVAPQDTTPDCNGIIFSNPFAETEESLADSGGVPEFLRNFNLEIQLLMRLDHPNIVKLYQVYETSKELFIVMQYVEGGEMVDYLISRVKFSEFEARKYFRQIVSALDHCHAAGVTHRDIKLENLLLTRNKDVVISDFGLGQTFGSEKEMLETCCGTPLYAPPEIVSGEKYYGPAADVWSAGVVLYLMVTGFPPFQAENLPCLYRKIRRAEYDSPGNVSNELKDLFSRVFQRNPSHRITVEQLRTHPWVNEGEDGPPEVVSPLFVASKDQQQPRGVEDLQKKYYALISGITHDEYDNVVYHFMSRARQGSAQRKESAMDMALQELRRKSAGLPPMGEPENESGAVSTSGYLRSRRHTLNNAKLPLPQAVLMNQVPTIATSANNTGNNNNDSNHGQAADDGEGVVSRYRRKTFQGEEIGKSANLAAVDQQLRPYLLDKLGRRRTSLLSSSSSSSCMPRTPQNVMVHMSNGEMVSSSLEGSATAVASGSTGPSSQNAVNTVDPKQKLSEEIRTMRLEWSTAHTFTKSPKEMLTHLLKILRSQLVAFERQRKYHLFCEYCLNQQDVISFEVEIFKVRFLPMHGIKFTYVGGSAVGYKHLQQTLVTLVGEKSV